MKKFLIVLLVLGFCPLANALELREDSKSDIYSLAYDSNTGMLLMLTDTAIASGGGKEMYWAIKVVTETVSLDNQSFKNFRYPAADDNFSVYVEGSAVLGDLIEGTNGILGGIYIVSGGPIPIGKVLYDIPVTAATVNSEILLGALNEEMSAIATVLWEGTFIPEPATIALLCLGGLLLKKKR
jgi:hypothetical protein